MELSKLLEYGPWGLAAFVSLAVIWMVFSQGMSINIKTGTRNARSNLRD